MTKYRFKTRPYRHQHQAVKRLLDQGYGGALLMEPRTGKTKTTIDWLCALAQRGEIDRAIIVAPNRVLGVWVQEFAVHAPIPYHLTVWDSKARKGNHRITPVSGHYPLEVVVVNYDAFASPGRKTASGRRSKASGRFKYRSLLRAWVDGKPCAGILDESHKIKSPSGRAANLIVSMHSDFSHRLILTGTPVTKAKRAFDVYMQWKFLNPQRFSHLPTVSEFKSHYGRWEHTGSFPVYKGPRNIEELRELMAEDAIIVRREDCFDLPPREDLVHWVPLKGETKKAYDEMAAEMITFLENGATAEASIALVQNLRLQQITSGFVTDETGIVHRLGFEKLDALRSRLEMLWDNEEKVVVAARWVADLDAIQDVAADIGFEVYAVRGGLKREETDQNVKKFKETNNPAVMVIQPSAASLGIDLSQASTMIWMSHVLSWVDFSQACDRIALSRHSTTFVHIIASKTVDEGIVQTLNDDGDLADAIMANPRAMLTGHTLSVESGDKLVGLSQRTKKGLIP